MIAAQYGHLDPIVIFNKIDLERTQQPDQAQVKQLLLDTYTDLDDWQSVLNLIPSIEKTGLYPREQIQAKQSQCREFSLFLWH